MEHHKKIDHTQFRDRPFLFLRFVAKQKKWFGIASVLCIITAGTIQAVSYPLIGQIADLLGSASTAQDIYMPVGLLITALFLKNIFYRTSGFFAAHWITFMEVFSAQISFDYLSHHSAGYFSNRLSGKLQNKIYNIANAVSAIFPSFLWNMLTFIIKVIALLVISFATDVLIGWVIAFFVVVSVIYNVIMSQKIAVYAREAADRGSHARGVIVDIISNILATKQNCAIPKESKKVGGVLDHYRKMHRKTWWSVDIILLFSNLIIIAMIAATILIALGLWQSNVISGGSVIMLFTMLIMLYGDLEFLSTTISRFMEQYGQLKEGLEEIFVSHEITDDSDTSSVIIEHGEIIFDAVDFHYEDDESQSVFNDLSLVVPAGQKIGLVGESGAGKSTFVSLLLRFRDVEGGMITVDGHDIRKIRQDDLRSAIAYVPQDALLFHRTLRENIMYGNEYATEKEMRDAAKRAHALDFIERFPSKFETLVGERGVKLSGGQKQRIMIARAMLKPSPILVLDEATSSLDSHAEKLIQEALEELMKGRTTIVIAHRLSTLKQMDRIIVFDNGTIVEDGTHEALLQKKGKYYALWQHQIGHF